MVIRTRIIPPGAAAFTVWPWIFVHPRYAGRPSLLLHESKHLEQQRRWFFPGLGVGIVAAFCLWVNCFPLWLEVPIVIMASLPWYSLYLLALPAGWNPFRARWEREAMRAEGRSDKEITEALKRAPYYLVWRQ